MDDVRVLIQSKLNEIEDVDCGIPIPDGMVEENQSYFGYELYFNYLGSDLNKNYTMEINLIGRLVRQVDPTEDTLQTMDNQLEEILEKLKELNFKYSYNDVSFEDNIRKYLINAYVRYNELNNTFII